MLWQNLESLKSCSSEIKDIILLKVWTAGVTSVKKVSEMTCDLMSVTTFSILKTSRKQGRLIQQMLYNAIKYNSTLTAVRGKSEERTVDIKTCLQKL